VLGWAREFLSQPWPFLTLVLLAVLGLVLHRFVARRFGWSRWPTLGMLLSIAIIAALTLPPAPAGSLVVPIAPGVSMNGPDPDVVVACLDSLTDPSVLWAGLITTDSLGERVGNILMFVPLAFFAVLAVRRRPMLAAGVVVLLPAGVEICQAVLGLGRECVGYDWANNGTGVVLGAIAGGVARMVRR